MRRLALVLPLLLPLPLLAEATPESPAPTPDAATAPETTRWGGEAGFAILGRDGEGLRLTTVVGTVRVGKELLDDATAAPALSALVARAAAAGIAGAEFALTRSALTGLRLASPTLIVTAEGPLAKQDGPAVDRAPDVAALRDAAKGLSLALPGRLSPLAARALGTVLDHLADADDPDLERTGVDPAVARRLAVSGYLAGFVDDAGPLRAAADAAAAPRAVSTWSGMGGRIEELVDAFGHRCWTLRSPAACVLLTPAPLPAVYPSARFEQALTRLELPAGADPLAPSDDEIERGAASLWVGGVELARWTRAGGLRCDEQAWRAKFPARPRGYEQAVDGFLPPHIAVRDGRGALRLLATAAGALRPPSGAADDGERFLREAALALPDAPGLGLLGDYLFSYCYDSPDPRLPRLIGTASTHGDVHQTAAQTVATAVAGRCLGDCDDLAELYQELCRRQGRNPIVIELPRHLACAFAERRGERWVVSVLHTGTPMQFAGAELPKAIVAMYQGLDPEASPDPNQIALSLRFAGENTRSSWRLSWRIFADPAYARTMIEVQRDWYFHTYQRGISTMQGLLAAGDDDTANYSELSGLYRRTGDWDRAIAFAREAMARDDAPGGALNRSISLASLLTQAGRHGEAAALARHLLEHELPAAADALGAAVPRTANRLAGSFDGARDPDLCLEILDRWSMPASLDELPALRRWIRDHFDARLWREHPQLVARRSEASGALAAAQGAMGRLGLGAAADEEGVADFARLTQGFLDDLAFRDDDPGSLARAYAFAGWYYELALGRLRLRELLAGAAFPTAPSDAHEDRLGGLAQLPLDLPWIKASVPYWWSAVGHDLWGERGKGPCDTDAARADLAALLAAHEAAQRLGLSSRADVEDAVQARLLAVLLAPTLDEAALAAALDAIAADHDRRLTESTATLIGRCAGLLPAERFARALAQWRASVDSKPFYFCIAWTALVAGADQAALAAARLAAERFADDPAFAEELKLIERRVAERAKPTRD